MTFSIRTMVNERYCVIPGMEWLRNGIKCNFCRIFCPTSNPEGATLAQYVKRWPTDLAVPDTTFAVGRNICSSQRVSIAQSFIIKLLI